MKPKTLTQSLVGSTLSILLSALSANAGTIFYQSIPATASDASSGISSDNRYTSAVDGGNSRGTDRVINGITLYALAAQGQSATADNCTLNALSGNLSNGGGKTATIQADGKFGEAASDMTFNNGATDNSQQEIVLHPESLEAGATYDLRVYICNSSGQDRQVSLSFVGDGQSAVETGWFNEEDARTSAGGFQNANQAYYINYRFTWDGDSTPGVTITQKSGRAPFLLYALTNQVVPGGGVQTAQQGGGDQNAQERGEDKNLNVALVNADSDDQVGVGSDDFYGSESLNSNGRWCNVQKYGKCWQPTNVPEGWRPYTNGTFENSDEFGATFVSDEPWAWACYHYGRWFKVSTGCGWCWRPGTTWAGAWVSWRKGTTDRGSCIGWAPLPPDVGCRVGIGINSSIDYSSGVGPECYTFVNAWDFGRESYAGCGCVLERSRYVNIILDTTCVTNIWYGRGGTYCGGVDFHWCNEQIHKHGGRECENVHVNRYDDPGKMGGKFMRKEGNSLGMYSPRVKGEKNLKHDPKTAEKIKSNQIDKGWKGMKNSNAEKQARDHIAQDGKGKQDAKATLPKDVQDKVVWSQNQGGNSNGQIGSAWNNGNVSDGNNQGGGKGTNKGWGGVNTTNYTSGGSTSTQGTGGQAGNNQGNKKSTLIPPYRDVDQGGGKGTNKGWGGVNTTNYTSGGSTSTQGTGDPAVKNRHPGQEKSGGSGSNTADAGPTPPSSSLKHSTGATGATGATSSAFQSRYVPNPTGATGTSIQPVDEVPSQTQLLPYFEVGTNKKGTLSDIYNKNGVDKAQSQKPNSTSIPGAKSSSTSNAFQDRYAPNPTGATSTTGPTQGTGGQAGNNQGNKKSTLIPPYRDVDQGGGKGTNKGWGGVNTTNYTSGGSTSTQGTGAQAWNNQGGGGKHHKQQSQMQGQDQQTADGGGKHHKQQQYQQQTQSHGYGQAMGADGGRHQQTQNQQQQSHQQQQQPQHQQGGKKKNKQQDPY